MNVTPEQIPAIIAEAKNASAASARSLYDKHGDHMPCGFAWVTIYDVKGNTKLGKALKAQGFDTPYTGGGLQLWNPSKLNVQNVDIKIAGADAFAMVLKSYGFTAYSGSRLD